MKLYTERQMREMFRMGLNRSVNEDGALYQFAPIELPSDEEIRKIMELDDMEFDEFDPYHVSHLDGAKWMRDKIQGGEQ